jgi:hypothetical protein
MDRYDDQGNRDRDRGRRDRDRDRDYNRNRNNEDPLRSRNGRDYRDRRRDDREDRDYDRRRSDRDRERNRDREVDPRDDRRHDRDRTRDRRDHDKDQMTIINDDDVDDIGPRRAREDDETSRDDPIDKRRRFTEEPTSRDKFEMLNKSESSIPEEGEIADDDSDLHPKLISSSVIVKNRLNEIVSYPISPLRDTNESTVSKSKTKVPVSIETKGNKPEKSTTIIERLDENISTNHDEKASSSLEPIPSLQAKCFPFLIDQKS